MLQAKITDFSIKKELSLKIGIPQRGILSLFLFNIFMYRFDRFFLQLKKRKTKPAKKKIKNPKYYTLTKTNEPEYKNFPLYVKQKIFYQKKQKVEKKSIHFYDLKKYLSLVKFYYVRYIDDLFFRFESSKKKTVTFLHKIQIFLKNDLKLNVTGIQFLILIATISFSRFFFKRYSCIIWSKSQQIEKFKKLKTIIINRHSMEYQSYLKIVEQLGKKVIRSFCAQALKKGQHRLKNCFQNRWKKSLNLKKILNCLINL